MFEDTEEMLSLYQAMDRMKDRYGFDAVMRCAGATFKPNNSRNFETQIITQCTSTVILHLRYGTIPLTNQQAVACNVEAMALTDINTVTEFMI
jgi:hypothetical protein